MKEKIKNLKNLDEKISMSVDPLFDFYEPDPIIQPYPEDSNYESSLYDEEDSESSESSSDINELNSGEKLQKIFFIFNHQNIWANIQILDPSKINFDLENKNNWVPFFENLQFHQTVESYWGTPFYTMKFLVPPLPRYLALNTVVFIQELVCGMYFFQLLSIFFIIYLLLLLGAITRWRDEHNLITVYEEQLIPDFTEILKLRQQKLDHKITERLYFLLRLLFSSIY